MPRTPPAKAWHALVREGRALSAALLPDTPHVHDEWMSMVWGPGFDRDYALALCLRRQGAQATELGPTLGRLMALANAFDALERAGQHRLRRAILRHRALQAPGTPWAAPA